MSSCSNTDVQPLKLTLSNVTLTDNGQAQSYGVAIQLGTPPQIVSLTPITSLNNTFVNNIANCANASDTACIAAIGGGFDPSKSSTIRRATQDSWNGSSEGISNSFANTASLYFNDVLTIGDAALPGFPALVQNSPTQLYAGLGLGANSSFVGRVVEAGLATSRSWGLYPGMYSTGRVGSLILGGYSEELYQGELISKNTSDPAAGACITCYDLASMTWNSNGTEVNMLPPTQGNPFQAQLEPYYPVLVVPDSVLWAFGNATNGVWDPANFAHNYTTMPEGNMTVTLSNGLRTVIPSEALFNPPAFDNGALSAFRNGTNGTIYSMLISWSSLYTPELGATITNAGIFGLPYAAYVYMVHDAERQTMSIAQANQDSLGVSNVKAICPLEGNGGEGGGTNVGAIAGGVVGGVVGLALIAGLIWFFLRRKKSKKAATSPEADEATKAELPPESAVLPKYSEQDIYAKNNKTTELPSENTIAEAEGTGIPAAKELPARSANSSRVELPG